MRSSGHFGKYVSNAAAVRTILGWGVKNLGFLLPVDSLFLAHPGRAGTLGCCPLKKLGSLASLFDSL